MACPHTENFNDGASLAAKGWTAFGSPIVNNEPSAGVDGTHALKGLNGLNGYQPSDVCDDSTRVTITFDWSRETEDVGFLTPFFILSSEDMIGNSSWDFDNGRIVSIGFLPGTENGQVLHHHPPGPPGNGFIYGTGGAGSGTFDTGLDNIYPTVGYGWVRARIDIVLSSAWDVGFGGPTDDGSIAFYWSDYGTVSDAALTLRWSVSGIRVTNPLLIPSYSVPSGKPYTHFNWTPHGYVDNICWDDYCASVEPGSPPVVDTTVPCECTPGGANPIEVPDPLVPFAPVYACIGGGTVEQLADLPGIGGCWL